MKVRASVKPMCQKCQVIRRRSGKTGKSVLRVICSNKKHKQKQG